MRVDDANKNRNGRKLISWIAVVAVFNLRYGSISFKSSKGTESYYVDWD